MSDSNLQRQTRRWLMFLIAPAQLLELLRALSHPTNRFAAGALPPDVAPVDAFYDETHNFLGMMLQSELFEPVEIEIRGEQMSAAWPRAIFTLEARSSGQPLDRELWGQQENDVAALHNAPLTPFHQQIEAVAERGFRVRALNFSADDLLHILRSDSPTQLPVFPLYADDVQIVNVIANPQIGGWTLFLEHPDFEMAKLTQGETEVLVEVPGDGHEMTFRFALPGATLQRKIGLDPDELNEF